VASVDGAASMRVHDLYGPNWTAGSDKARYGADIEQLSVVFIGSVYNAEVRNAEYRCGMHKIPRTVQYFCKMKS